MLIIVMTILVNAVPKLITFIVEPAQKFMVSVRKTDRRYYNKIRRSFKC